jgi:hypothetical protein
MAVAKRALELTQRNFGKLIGIGIVYILISGLVEWAIASADETLGWTTQGLLPGGIGSSVSFAQPQHSIPATLLSMVFSTFLGTGLSRVALNFASGEDTSEAMLFSQGSKLLRMLGGWFLYGLMVVGGILLLIVPGIYLALRFGMFQYAIIDRNMGVIDSLKYSSELTKENRMNLFGLGCMMVLIILAGVLALLVGLIFAIPVVTLMMPLAYRFLQFGPQALADHPGNKVPLLRGQVPNQ